MNQLLSSRFISRPIKHALRVFGFELRPLPRNDTLISQVPDGNLYLPNFSPWLGDFGFERYYQIAATRSLVSRHRCHVLYTMLKQCLFVPGDIWECGVYKGGTAAMMASILKASGSEKKLLLFDTFEGMPATDPVKDLHQLGDFADTSLADVKEHIGNHEFCEFHQGFIPHTFQGLDGSRIAAAHIDLDIYRSVFDCIEFIWPRLSVGGVVVFDDYGFRTCPGARAAVDEFFTDRNAIPLCLSTGQAVVMKSGDSVQ